MTYRKQAVLLPLVSAVVVLNLFFVLVLAYTLHASKLRQEAEVRTTVENLAFLLDRSVTAAIRELDIVLGQIGVALERELRQPTAWDEVAAAYSLERHWLEKIADIRVTDASGKVVRAFGMQLQGPVDHAGWDFFEAHRGAAQDGLIASRLLPGRGEGDWQVVFSRRYLGPGGRFAGVITAAVPARYFEQLLSGLRLGPNGIALVRDLDMTLIARLPPSPVTAAQVGSRGGSRELADILASGTTAESFYSARTADGINRINAFRRLSLLPAFVVVGWGEEDYLAPWWREVRTAAVLALIFLAVTTLAGRGLWYLVSANERANQRSRILLENASDGIHITDLDGNLIEANEAFCRMLGYSREQVLGMNAAQWDANRDAEQVRRTVREIHASGDAYAFETWHCRANGEIFPVEVNSHALELDGQPVVFHASRDTSARKASEEAIRKLAFFDPLTGLPNRRLLMDRLGRALRAGTEPRALGALLFIDLDNFKSVNDTCGHYEGDRLLQQVAEVLRGCVRKEDSVARLGGDEFVVMLEGLSERSDEASHEAERVADTLLLALRRTFRLGSFEYRGSASIGVTLFGMDLQESLDEPLKRADLAMYQAKQAGRDAVRFFHPQMQRDALRRTELDASLWRGLERDEFFLHYQPQVRADGLVIATEALVRWRHPQLGVVSPAEFIPLAEESGFILPLGRWVFERVCEQLARWASDPCKARVSIAVNVSARQLQQASFVDEVLAILADSGADPTRLEIELTESSLLADVEGVIAKMEVLKARGVSFSLDDFGTGYSSLAYLKRLPLDQLKIDQSFVRDVLVDPNDAAIAKMVIVLADSLGLRVIAEGVETERQRDFLAEQGCDAYQGYFYSRPLPLDELETYLEARWATWELGAAVE